jgi:hypoxia up-regulated 1
MVSRRMKNIRSTSTAVAPSPMFFFVGIVLTCLLGLFLLPQSVDGRAILGVDLGSLYMKVALVQSGSPLEIVTNLHSKRKTEQMVLFDSSQRFYGADASALLARKAHQTPVAMSVMLGRDETHPVVKVRVRWDLIGLFL